MMHPFRIILASVIAALILPSPSQASWKSEPMSQSYVNLGCGADQGTVLLSINTGTTKYLVSSTSPLFKSTYSITTKAVAKDRRIRVLALSSFPTISRSYKDENGNCSEMSGVDLLGIGFDVLSSSTSTRRSLSSSQGISVSRTSVELRLVGVKDPVELVTVGGRLLGRLHPDSEGSTSIPLQGLPRGLLLVRSGGHVFTFHNL